MRSDNLGVVDLGAASASVAPALVVLVGPALVVAVLEMEGHHRMDMRACRILDTISHLDNFCAQIIM